MDFDSPDVEKDFPGLYASENGKKSQSRDSDYSEEERTSCKDLLGKKREKRESKKDKGYAALEGESSCDDETKSPGKIKKTKPTFKLVKDKKEKHNKKDKDGKEKKEEKEKVCKKESKEMKKEYKEAEKAKDKTKKKKEHKLLKIKEKKKKSIDHEVAGVEEKPIFGVPLHIALERNKSHDGIEIPVVVRECIDYIEEHGLACEGIYKISGLKSKVHHLKSQYNKREKVYLYEHEPHIVASLIKQFLRDLPEPILTSELAPKFEDAAALKNEKKRIEAFQTLLNELPNCNRALLSWIFVHMLHVVNLEKRNKMTIQNVSIALSPTLHISHHVLQALFAYSHILFKGVEIKKYVPPIELDSSRLSIELPDSPSAIADELNKQENILNHLHAELNSGVRDKEKEEKLWEIQRVVTQLKRKLRFLKQVQSTSTSSAKESQTVKTCDTSDVSSNNGKKKQNMDVKNVNPTTSIQPKVNEKELPIVVKDSPSEKVENIIKLEVNPKSFKTSEVMCENKSEVPLPLNKIIDLKNTTSVHHLSKSQAIETTDLPAESNMSIDNAKSEIDASVKEAEVSCDALANMTPNLPDTSDGDIDALVHEVKMLQILSEELMLLGDELRRKVFSEKMEIERLKAEIHEYQQLYKYKRYSFDSTENSSSDTEDSSDSDEEQMSSVLEDLIKENTFLEAKNVVLSKVIQKERETCLNIKVQLKLLQQTDMKSDANYHTRM